jgi:predicted enzyme related to lactoylglutathione lyase
MKLAQKLIEIMVEIHLSLVVIRSVNLEESVKFYQMLGLNFEKHQHGNGLEHFASNIGQVTFEIYPQTARMGTTTGTRLGLQVPDVDSLVIRLQKENVTVITKPSVSEWGRRAVVVDPDGHRIELVQL